VAPLTDAEFEKAGVAKVGVKMNKVKTAAVPAPTAALTKGFLFIVEPLAFSWRRARRCFYAIDELRGVTIVTLELT
jgi:hypothetical protein